MTQALRGQFVATVKANLALCREHFKLVLALPEFPTTAPGQFIQLSCRNLETTTAFEERELEWPPSGLLLGAEDELVEPSALLRRPFSLAGHRDTASGVELDIIHRVVGVGTDWLSRLHAGDRAFLLGPLGNRFKLPEADQTALLVGGGVGIPPMLYLAEALAGRKAVAFAGALTRDLLPFTFAMSAPSPDNAEPAMVVEEFARHQIPSVITTDDGTVGFRGFVTQALEKYLDAHPSRHLIYTCGPEIMMRRVADIAAARGIDCQVAVERAMACGMGTCQSCCIRTRDTSNEQGWRYRLACTDGPVFSGADLLW